MANCLHCNLKLSEDDQVYYTRDFGSDIMAILEHNLSSEVNIEGVLCSYCFETIIQDLPCFVSQRSDNTCVMCCRSLHNRRCHAIGESARNYLAERILPRQVYDGALVCYSCWVHIYTALRQQGIVDTPSENSTCVWCRRSLAKTRRHSLPEGPEQNYIATQIHPRVIPLGGRVCFACWTAVRRNIQRQQNINHTPSENPQLHRDCICVWCESSLFRRRCHRLLPGPERTEVADRIYPRQLPENVALVCDNCWHQAQDNIQRALDASADLPNQERLLTISLDEFKHTTNSSARCFVPECTNQERSIVPKYLRIRILKSQKVFVMENARICNHHKTLYDWEFLDQHEFSHVFTTSEVEAMLRLSIGDA